MSDEPARLAAYLDRLCGFVSECLLSLPFTLEEVSFTGSPAELASLDDEKCLALYCVLPAAGSGVYEEDVLALLPDTLRDCSASTSRAWSVHFCTALEGSARLRAKVHAD